MNRHTVLKIACFTILALVMLSCTDTNLFPVFYALEQEKSLVDDRGFPDDAVVLRIIQNVPGGNYFAAAGILYTRAPSGGTWSPIAAPVAGALCTNVEIFGAPAQLVAAFTLSDNTGLGLWQRNVTLDNVWTRVPDPILGSNIQVGVLRAVNLILFASTLSGGTYSLYYSSALPAFTATNVTAALPSGGPISDIEWDPATSDYWVTVGSTLMSSTALPTFNIDSGATTSRPFGGLYFSTALNTLYLAADGKFYTKVGAGSWSASSTITVDSQSVQFTTFVEIPTPPLATADVYAGTGGYGYYVTSSLFRSPSYTISALFDGAILSMLYDGSGATPTLLLGTYNSGLWRGDWDSTSSTWVWKQE